MITKQELEMQKEIILRKVKRAETRIKLKAAIDEAQILMEEE